MGTVIDYPFGPPVSEVPLSRPPLALVVAQVQFPAVVSIAESEGFIAVFQEQIRHEYPVLRREMRTQVLLGPEGPVQQTNGHLWRFEQGDGPWFVTLTSNALSLVAHSNYTSRTDLLGRFAWLLQSLQGWLSPAVCDRLGVRYVNRITDANSMLSLENLIRPQVRGVASFPTGDELVEPVHSLSDATFRHSSTNSELHARWGLIPAGATFDPSLVPADSASWVMDLDSYTLAGTKFDTKTLVEVARAFTIRSYRFFRWSVTDDFLRSCGGKP